MMFVTVGTDLAPFDRLLQAVEQLDAPETLVVQYGSSKVKPRNASCVDFLPFDAWVDHIRQASAVVTHGGVGSIMVALMNGKRPFVVPRLRRYGEAVDDHQQLFGRRFGEDGHVIYVEDPADLAEAIRTSETTVPLSAPKVALAANLRSYLDTIIPDGGAPRR